MNETMLLLEILFRQERYEEALECLLRIQETISKGEPPKDIMESPRVRHLAPFMHMYDYWYKARFTNDPERRKDFAMKALYWCIELGMRTTGSILHIRFFHFQDACEIIGEFDLFENKQKEFLRHFKRFTLHASVSFYKKMIKNPVKPITFQERNLPTFDEFKAMYDKKYGKKKK